MSLHLQLVDAKRPLSADELAHELGGDQLSALVSTYRFILACHATKKASQAGCPNDAENLEDDRTDTKPMPQ
jgi:hypothetical protein